LKQDQARVLGGIGFVVLACACFAVLDTTAKYVVLTVPILMAAWVRYFLQALVSSLVLLPLHGAQVLRTAKPGLQLVRGLLLMSSSLLAFVSLRFMPVGEFTAIVMVTPLGVTLLAVTLLKERIAPLHWVFVVGGFVGVLAIARPGSHDLGWAALLPVGCMVINSVFQLLSSHLGKTEKAATTHLYTSWIGTLALSLLLPDCLGRGGVRQDLGPDAADGLHGRAGPFRIDSGLCTGPGGHAGALPVHPHRVCRHRWLAGVRPVAGRLVLVRHRADRRVGHLRRLVHRPREQHGRAACRKPDSLPRRQKA
jgi:hypothetical protein